MMAGHSRNLVTSLEECQAVNDIERVTGPYDVIALLEATDINDISDIVADEIHVLAGVVRTTTCVCVE
jgi:DNA-binding Lrp family transcriptional regulator